MEISSMHRFFIGTVVLFVLLTLVGPASFGVAQSGQSGEPRLSPPFRPRAASAERPSASTSSLERTQETPLVRVAQAGENGTPTGESGTQGDGAQVASESASETDSMEPAPIEENADPDAVLEKTSTEIAEKTKATVDAVKQGDFSQAKVLAGQMLKDYGVPAVTVLLVVILAYFVAKYLSRIAAAPVRKRVDETLGRFVGKLVYYLIMVSAFLGVLQYFGIGVASFAAVLAAAGFAVGLAFQGTLSNFAAGIMLLVFRPFKVGDVINAAGITAKVFEIDLFATAFDTPDNRRIIVPNSSIASGTIENISHHGERRVDVNVGVDYAASLDDTREVLTEAAELLRGKLIDGEGRGYQIVLVDLGDSAVNWTVRFWTTAADYWGVKEELTHAVKAKLDEAGIGIPFPQMDVHVVNNQ